MYNPMNNLGEQILNISKAGAFDIVSKQVGELKEENTILRKGIQDITDEICKMDLHEVVTKPSLIIQRINLICSNTLNAIPL